MRSALHRANAYGEISINVQELLLVLQLVLGAAAGEAAEGR
jgi:hypothetical protein